MAKVKAEILGDFEKGFEEAAPSTQLPEDTWDYDKTGGKEPPYNLDALAYLLEINTWHLRCCKTKAIVTAGLGYDFVVPEGYIRLNGGISIFAGYSGAFPWGVQNVEVHGFFGFEEVPPEVKEACILLALQFLRARAEEADVSQSQANTTSKAVGIKRVKVDDLSVEYEYPRSATVEATTKRSTALAEADRLLWRYRRDLEAMAV